MMIAVDIKEGLVIFYWLCNCERLVPDKAEIIIRLLLR